jgi:hypothetical protein
MKSVGASRGETQDEITHRIGSDPYSAGFVHLHCATRLAREYVWVTVCIPRDVNLPLNTTTETPPTCDKAMLLLLGRALVFAQ